MAIIYSKTCSVKDLLLSKEPLNIPAYQRPYSWNKEVALQLMYDLIREENQGHDYLLGTVVLHQDEKKKCNIVDGQHRLLTLKLLLDLLQDNQAQPCDSLSDTPLNQVRYALCQHINRHLTNQETQDNLANFINKNCKLFTIVTDDLDQAFRIFDSQNTRGKPLDPHDLLKAYHLRAVEDSFEKECVVRYWDSLTGNKDGKRMLTILFSRYLYPIACWTREKRAIKPFGKQHIHYFQGFRNEKLPAALYHQHASQQCDSLSGHATFQLDAPMQDGAYFFKYVKFMLEELKRLSAEVFPDKKLSYYGKSESLNREGEHYYRYVTELYLATLLYYVNRFGNEHFEQAKDVFIKWSYSLRIKYKRLAYNTIDNHARGQGAINPYPLFRHIRNGTDPLKLLFELPILPPKLEKEDHKGKREFLLKKVFNQRGKKEHG